MSLDERAAAAGHDLDSVAFAKSMDAADELHKFRSEFHMPLHSDGSEQVYLTGNSLGLQPKSTAAAVTAELQKWAAIGVGGHFTGDLPWAQCEEKLPELLGEVVGAEDAELEVAAMNTLTVNLHMLMAAFYRPSGERSTIIIEAGAFPSDRYAVASQLAHHGVPADRLVEVGAAGEVLATADVVAAIEANHERLALVLLGGVNYLTGQVFDMGAIAAAVHRLNAAAPDRPPVILGYDLAHAVGNVPLRLHEWGVDFAAWCSYKYLNAGAGCIAGMFVHSKHATDFDAHPRLAGWWGVPFGKRFVMAHGFEPAAGAPGFAVSNVNPLLVACAREALRVLKRAGGVAACRRKSLLLTAYLAALIERRGLCAAADGRCAVQIVTPADADARGCQLSLRVVAANKSMRELEGLLADQGCITDAREPDIVRASPAPLYNSFEDVYKFVGVLADCLAKM